jgi:FkbM family methyltransferase
MPPTENDLIGDYFKDKAPRFFVDVGAADGIKNSNTYNLAKQNWKGILIEPNPVDYQKLYNLYKNKSDYTVLNMAICDHPGNTILYCEPGQSSTLSVTFRNEIINRYGTKYNEVSVWGDTLTNALTGAHCPKVIDFLSVDAEGLDIIVLKSMDWERYWVEIVCAEHSMPKKELKAYMDSIGFKYYAETEGNTLFINTKPKT